MLFLSGLHHLLQAAAEIHNPVPIYHLSTVYLWISRITFLVIETQIFKVNLSYLSIKKT